MGTLHVASSAGIVAPACGRDVRGHRRDSPTFYGPGTAAGVPTWAKARSSRSATEEPRVVCAAVVTTQPSVHAPSARPCGVTRRPSDGGGRTHRGVDDRVGVVGHGLPRAVTWPAMIPR